MQGLNAIDVITPRDIYRCLVQDRIFCNLRDYDVSQTKRQVNAFIYVWTMLPTQSPFCTDYPYSTWRELPFWAFIVRGKDS